MIAAMYVTQGRKVHLENSPKLREKRLSFLSSCTVLIVTLKQHYS